MIRPAGIAVDAVSQAGVETCIQLPELGLCFDMGICPRNAVRLPKVLFTHAHVDHMAGVIHHCATRRMLGMKPPTYVMPERNVPAFHRMLDAWRELDGGGMDCQVLGLPAGDSYPLGANLRAQAYATPHRVVSQGYVLMQRRQHLRPEYALLPELEIRGLRMSGVDVSEPYEFPLVAFTGDSRVDILDSAPIFRKASLLIMEVTFLDDRVDVARTREKGHIHLDEVLERADLFENEAILFTHLSARYSPGEAVDLLRKRLPLSLRERVWSLSGPGPVMATRTAPGSPG